MISIRNAVAELERCHLERDTAIGCYLNAIRNIAQYTIELSEEITAQQRAHLTALAEDVAANPPGALEESRATLRSLLRDYRDKAAQYLNALREELGGTARALEEILDSLTQSDGDHETRVRKAISTIRDISASPAASAVRAALLATADSIEESVEQMRKQHQLTVSQFQTELRMLHKRIDALEASASLDLLTQLLNRHEIEERIRSAPLDSCLLLVRVQGFRLAEAHFRAEVAAELTAAFTKRLRNSIPPTAAIGRWSHEEFAIVLPISRTEANSTAKWVAEHLSGSYACLLGGKTVRPSLQISVAVMETNGNTPDRLIERVKAFLIAG
jgi:GGDEF domain-containing protein